MLEVLCEYVCVCVCMCVFVWLSHPPLRQEEVYSVELLLRKTASWIKSDGQRERTRGGWGGRGTGQ